VVVVAAVEVVVADRVVPLHGAPSTAHCTGRPVPVE
jgi:hypothetical protein